MAFVSYNDNITISLMVRQALYFLPEAIRIFEESEAGVQITPLFQYDNGLDSFLKNESDIIFSLKEQTKQLAGVNVHELFNSHIYLITPCTETKIRFSRKRSSYSFSPAITSRNVGMESRAPFLVTVIDDAFAAIFKAFSGVFPFIIEAMK